ncbi:MAG: PHP domain-containing protein [Actinomycetota bacterium]
MGSEQPPWRTAIDRVIYLLDRDLAPVQKVRAFVKARQLLGHLEPDQVEALVRAGKLQAIDGIGPSTDAVVRGAYGLGPTDYLDGLEASTALDVEGGARLRAALRGDCHSHSTWSDGGAELTAMAAAAAALGHDYLAATDHSARLTVAKGLSPERLARQIEEIEALNVELAPFRILTGMEVDILTDGSLDLPDEFLARLDVVVASVHHEIHQPAAEMTKRLVTAVASPHVDILGHCTNRKVAVGDRRGGRGRKPSEFDADYVFAACAQFGTAVEINCRPERQDPPDELIELAMEWDCRLSIDSDAHAPGQLEWVAYGCERAERLGVEPDRVINTRSADDLLDLVAG